MMLIIALGDPLRGDDGAGIVLGELLEQICRLRQINVQRLVCQQLAAELVPQMMRPTSDAFIASAFFP
ncbi:hypothetical protein KQH41_01950 [bacterium]|nr:hypothetical protein [bacterium]